MQLGFRMIHRIHSGLTVKECRVSGKLNAKKINSDSNFSSQITISKNENQKQNLKTLSEKWKNERLKREAMEKKTFGFTKNAEILNGRVAMIFLVTGILTEIWTKQNFIAQIELILRTLGII